MATGKKVVPELETKAEPENKMYEKDQLLTSEKYAAERDIVDALLNAGEKYKLEDVDKKIENFKKGKVN